MLTQLRFQNFKSWRDTGDIRIAPLTGIFGTNSSGKTAILQFLLMLKQTVETLDSRRILHLGDENTYINLGTSYDIAHRHQLPTEISYSLHWNTTQGLKRYAITVPSKGSIHRVASTLRFDSDIRLSQNDLEVTRFCYGYQTGDDDEWQSIGTKLSTISDDHGYDLFVQGSSLEDIIQLPQQQPSFFSPVKSYQFSPEALHWSYQYEDFLPLLVFAYEKMFETLFYLGPLRDYPRRLYLWSGEQPQDVGKRGELAIAALLGSRKDNPELEQKVAYWLKELGLIHGFRVQSIAEHRQDYEVLVQCAPHAPEVLITDVGFGVSQVLPVLVLCYYVPKGSVVLLEQPEIHLHPSVQSGLADMFIDAIETRQIRIIVESHSEHLLHRLQRRIAEEKLAVEDAALYFCRMDDTGESHLETLQLDPYGNITNWPPNFFGDKMSDLIAMTEAEMRRQGVSVP